MKRVAQSVPFAALLLLTAFVPVTLAQTQTSSQTVGRDPQAVLVAQTALSAMGGPGVIGQIQNSTVTGTSLSQAEAESETRSFVWTYAGNEFRNENDAATGSHVLVSNSGNPQDYREGTWVTSPAALSRTNLPYHIPALVLFSELNNAGYGRLCCWTGIATDCRSVGRNHHAWTSKWIIDVGSDPIGSI